MKISLKVKYLFVLYGIKMHVKFKGNSIFEELKHLTCCHSLIIKYFGLVKKKKKKRKVLIGGGITLHGSGS